MQYKYDNSLTKWDKPKHQHLLDLHDTGEFKRLSGTSSVVDVLAKVLTWWASGKAVETLGWIHPDIKKCGKKIGEVPLKERLASAHKILTKIKRMKPAQYLSLLDEAYKAHSVNLKDTAKAGTDLHAELERFVKTQMGIDFVTVPENAPFDPRIQPFIEWADHAVKRYLWSEAHCFHEGLWVGGISDVGVELNAQVIETPDGQIEVPDRTLAIIDFKSAKEVYASHYIQAAGYSLEIKQNGLLDAEGKRISKLDRPIEALIIIPFGADIIYPEIRMKVPEYEEAFKHCLALYRILGMDKSEYKK